MRHDRNPHRKVPALAFSFLVCLGCTTSPPPVEKEFQFALDCQPQDSGTNASLRGLSVISPEVAWVSGSGGVFARTMDGGRTWINGAVAGAESLDFRDVEAFDEKSACLMAAGKSARILKTWDGGANWRETYRNEEPGVFLDSMAFWDRRLGIAFSDPVGGSFLVIRTQDGGDTWEPVESKNLPKPVKGEAGFAASGTSIAVQKDGLALFATGGGAARVFRSADGGSTWKASDTPLQNGNPSQGIFSMAFRDTKRGVIVGGDFQYPKNSAANAAVTDDGGLTWKPVETASPEGYRSCAAWTWVGSRSVLVAVGTSGSDYSLDGGVTWLPLGSEGYHVIAFSGAVGWAAGADGRISRCEAIIR